MNFWLQFALYRLMEEAGADVTGAAVVDPTPAADAGGAATDATPLDPAPSGDSNASPDLFGNIDDIMKGLESPADPAADAAQATPGADFAPLLKISPFVTAPEHVSNAIQAANEVWQVASGQIPARKLLEGIQQANPAQFEAIKADLVDYLGANQAQANPLEALKTENKAVYDAIADFYQKQTGKSLDGPADPREARLSALEQRYAAEEKARQEAAFQQQVDTARTKATEFVTSAIKGTFAEGMEQRYLAPNSGLVWQKAEQMKIHPEALMNELLSGKTETLERVLKAVKKDELAIVKQYTEKLVKHQKVLAGAVPATGTPAKGKDGAKDPAKPLPNETPFEQYQRLKKSGVL